MGQHPPKEHRAGAFLAISLDPPEALGDLAGDPLRANLLGDLGGHCLEIGATDATRRDR
jgi:hypothetical protein